MKKWNRLVAALCALLVLAGCAAALLRIVYGRSLKASLYELVLRRRFATDRTAATEVERLEAKRAQEEKPYAIPERLSFQVKVVETEREGLQIFTLNPGSDGSVVLYLHGGAYINGFNDYQWRFMNRLARETGCEIVAPAYHLAPFADYTRAYEDLPALYRALTREARGRRLLLMGDSAGGGLALGLGEFLAAAGDPLPEGMILISPWVDVSMDNPEITRYVPVDPVLHLDLTRVHGQYWAGESDVHDWHVSPLFGEMRGLPRTTIYCGTRELLYPDITLAYEKLIAAGVQAEIHVGRGLNHDYPLMPLPEADAAFDEIAALVRG